MAEEIELMLELLPSDAQAIIHRRYNRQVDMRHMSGVGLLKVLEV